MKKYKIIDVTEWKISKGYLKGTKEKEGLTNPVNEELVMFKEPAENSGDVWSEKLASEIGLFLGFNVQKVDIAKNGDKYGALIYYSLNLNEEKLLEGADLIKSEKKFNEYKRNGYDFQLIEKTLERFGSNLINCFLEIIVFDILIGNTDRHSQNWGLIVDTNDKVRVAPAYDNSSSLGREFHSNYLKVEMKIKDENAFKSYCNSKKGSYMIGWNGEYKIPHFRFLELIYEVYPFKIKTYIEKIRKLSDDKIEEIVEAIPNEIMKDINKKFAKKILKYRRDYMLAYIEKGEKNEI